jgi:hypothetical protein
MVFDQRGQSVENQVNSGAAFRVDDSALQPDPRSTVAGPRGLTEGRIVHYILPAGYRYAGEHRAAVVVKVWDGQEGVCNLRVFLDNTNDDVHWAPEREWKTSVRFDASASQTGTWHYPEYTQ